MCGLIGAAISGSANAITAIIVAPETFNLREGFNNLMWIILTGAIFGAGMYLKQSPLPPEVSATPPSTETGTANNMATNNNNDAK